MTENIKVLRQKLSNYSKSTTEKIATLMTTKERFCQINKIVMESQTEQEVLERLNELEKSL